MSVSQPAQNTINSVSGCPAPDSTRVEFDLHYKPVFSYFILKNASGLVVDLENTKELK
ncbi:N-acetylmuramoyl-L-alanine amidase, partial [Pseudoalteromonas sp. S409]